MNVTFFKRPRANSNDITVCLAIQSRTANINIKRATKASIHKNEWNGKTARPKATAKNKQINTYLDSIKGNIENHILEFEKVNKFEIGHTQLKKYIDNLLSNIKEERLTDLLNKFFGTERILTNSAKTNLTKRRHIDIFIKAVNNCTAKQLNESMIESYRKELLELDLELATINTHLKNVRSFLNYLAKKNYTKSKFSGSE